MRENEERNDVCTIEPGCHINHPCGILRSPHRGKEASKWHTGFVEPVQQNEIESTPTLSNLATERTSQELSYLKCALYARLCSLHEHHSPTALQTPRKRKAKGNNYGSQPPVFNCRRDYTSRSICQPWPIAKCRKLDSILRPLP